MDTIKNFRKCNKLSQVALAEYLQVTQGFISQIEKDLCPTPDWVISKLLENPHNWNTSMLIEVESETPAPSQGGQDSAVVELLKEQNAELLAKIDLLNQQIGELRALLKREGEESAAAAGSSLSADAV